MKISENKGAFCISFSGEREKKQEYSLKKGEDRKTKIIEDYFKRKELADSFNDKNLSYDEVIGVRKREGGYWVDFWKSSTLWVGEESNNFDLVKTYFSNRPKNFSVYNFLISGSY